MNNRYAVVNSADEVVNIIKWDGKSRYDIPEGHRLQRVAGAPVDIGDTLHEDGTFIKPQPEETEETP